MFFKINFEFLGFLVKNNKKEGACVRAMISGRG